MCRMPQYPVHMNDGEFHSFPLLRFQSFLKTKLWLILHKKIKIPWEHLTAVNFNAVQIFRFRWSKAAGIDIICLFLELDLTSGEIQPHSKPVLISWQWPSVDLSDCLIFWVEAQSNVFLSPKVIEWNSNLNLTSWPTLLIFDWFLHLHNGFLRHHCFHIIFHHFYQYFFPHSSVHTFNEMLNQFVRRVNHHWINSICPKPVPHIHHTVAKLIYSSHNLI